MADKEYLLWLDVETSGLDPHEDVLLEVAAIVTDLDLVPIHEGARSEFSAVCKLPADLSIAHVKTEVLAMHVESGLWAACQQGGHEPEVVIKELVNWASRATEYAHGTVFIAGRSVHFDLEWIMTHGRVDSVKDLQAMLHHRRFDLSSVKMFARMIGLEVPDLPGKHRALADLHDDIALVRQLWYQTRQRDLESLHHVTSS